MKQNNYVAVIGDIIGSREVEERGGLQTRLQATVARANLACRDTLASSFVLTLGDEFQGLLNSPDDLHWLLARFRADLHTAEVRFGIGIGPLETPLEPQALGMDGPCFHHAREAVERAAARETYVEVSIPDDSGDQGVFDVYAVLSAAIRHRWTRRQCQVVDLTMAGSEGKEVAVRLAITPSAVSQHLRAAGGQAIAQATRAWQAALQRAFLRLK